MAEQLTDTQILVGRLRALATALDTDRLEALSLTEQFITVPLPPDGAVQGVRDTGGRIWIIMFKPKEGVVA